jgi:hypothetical protein
MDYILFDESLLPQVREADLKSACAQVQVDRVTPFTTASPPSGSKLPRHNGHPLHNRTTQDYQ